MAIVMTPCPRRSMLGASQSSKMGTSMTQTRLPAAASHAWRRHGMPNILRISDMHRMRTRDMAAGSASDKPSARLDGSEGPSSTSSLPSSESVNPVASTSSSNGNSPDVIKLPSYATSSEPSTSDAGYISPVPEPPPEPKGGMPHRWKVVAMIAVAFVLGESLN